MKATQAAINDEQAIRDSVDTWLEASKRGDLTTMLDLLDDDVLFITPGKEPFGKKEFAGNGEAQAVLVEADLDIKEIKVTGDWAWMRSYLEASFKSAGGGNTTKISGHILSIFRKTADSKWLIYRDANFCVPESAN